MKKIVGLGEILLRLSPPNYQTMVQASRLECQFGGSELNVLATLAQLGHATSLISAIPDNELGKMAEHFLFARQICQDYLIKRAGRLGLYYYQKGFSVRASQVIYDRDFSSFSRSSYDDYHFDHVFDQVDWFHVSGITAALNEATYDLTYRLMTLAREKGVKISLDLNYRATLWASFQEARERLSPLVQLANICIGLEPILLLDEQGRDLKDELQLLPPYDDRASLRKVLAAIEERYQLDGIAFTQREMGYSNQYQLKAFLYQNGSLYETDKETIQVLDRVGTGDAFTAGIIHGCVNELASQKVVEIAMASFVFKHTIEGDVNVMTPSDIDRLLAHESYEIKR
ncbi:sugar kinase [Streptococcus acidominimus]|uniref:2-dehydro-3-deoxygluconokinase n=1 Tax=Streptococcus acidominimus TaxID=1326 RepID=A0A1Q8EE72_STRAI|nr:sugar kinase [Streptococcus acidominimus]OLF50104.1 2-dehydro-3-deoxygluconokinase [Streptococcus acidominimus]SUN08112.1 ribokinase family sugar kinase [Streptococcus acidominimus]